MARHQERMNTMGYYELIEKVNACTENIDDTQKIIKLMNTFSYAYARYTFATKYENIFPMTHDGLYEHFIYARKVLQHEEQKFNAQDVFTTLANDESVEWFNYFKKQYLQLKDGVE